MDDVEVRVGLPLPLDVMTTIWQAFAVLWPGARVDTRRGTPQDLIVVIPDGERMTEPTRGALAAAKEYSEDTSLEGLLASMDPDGTIGLSLPQVANLKLAEICVAMLTASEAVNYLETPVTTKDGQRFAVAACRSIKQTPHQLRMDAEKHLGEARDKLALIEAVIGQRTRDRKDSEFSREVRAILDA